jgi:Xaa-Pro aminopeptidase
MKNPLAKKNIFTSKVTEPSMKERLSILRQRLDEDGLDGFLVPRSDEFKGEYVAPYAERLTYISGFTGSAGFAVIIKDKAALFVDGRYTLQAAQQVDEECFDLQALSDNDITSWLNINLPEGAHIGFDGWLHSPSEIKNYIIKCPQFRFVDCTENLIDLVWENQPDRPAGEVILHAIQYSGVVAEEKCQVIASKIKEKQIESMILTLPDSICWLLNIRGTDLEYTTITQCFAVIHNDARVDLYIDSKKLSNDVESYFKDINVAVHPFEDFIISLALFNAQSIGIDPRNVPYKVCKQLEQNSATIHNLHDPCILPKAKKNKAELAGMRSAHLIDGIAVTNFLAWLDKNSSDTKLTEIDVANKIYEFRQKTGKLRGLSFPTISGSGPDGAIVHYFVTEQSNRQLDQNSLLLVDSGAQYFDGTTDITRTVAIGEPSAEHRESFTRVLKGHIALALAKFPEGTTGHQLDVLARYHLWQAGLDYAHGTGHGVGAFMHVHEGPQNISKAPNPTALQAGMVISNEPGYYKAGEYGIRIENLVIVRPSDGGKMLEFETLTLAPLDKSLIDADLMTSDEIAWVNKYHERVKQMLSPHVDIETASWLEQATSTIS